ncbi:hypothetical protein AMK26_18625 [Streptomyces sp. CB03234]|uniref:hypothetical protein n=1 Tax=Streptomyces sp. (strain CB03234) TaxID=1703937 RepID=UPI0009391807|nr:hypothetical protein [Streptomyces sp. CB03234]OKK03504.1 hypothetical protein AMK26_18625 [Streptomyces sp. CB03234]
MNEGRSDWIRVPVGDDASRWTTRGRCRRVLLVVHNVTSATRLLDIVPLFHDDVRVQLLASCTGSSPFSSGVAELLAETGVPVVPWEQAVHTPVDLAISASFGGRLRALPGTLIVLSHGVGYTKTLAKPGSREAGKPGSREAGKPGSREAGKPGSREAGKPGSREAGKPGSREAGKPVPVFGLSPEWLLSDDDGRPIADALVLSHPEQLDRLRTACPEAAPTAVLAGDPCFDRMLAATRYRERFRRALGVRRGQRLVVLNSTWNPESLFGDGGDDVLPSLLPRLTAELPADEYRLAAVLHPNIWHGHGPGQIRAWLDRARRGGLTLVDPLEDWRQAVIAADAVIGDHGSVTYYAAALGTPVLLGAAPLAGLDPHSPAADFVRRAPRLDPDAPVRPQLDSLVARHRPLPGPREFTTSLPGESATRLRRLFYDSMGVPEPSWPALLEPLPLPRHQPAVHTAPLRVLTRLVGACDVAVERYADPSYAPEGDGEAHTAVHEDTRDPGALDLADVIVRHGSPDDPRLGSPPDWTAEVLNLHPHCALAVYVTGPGDCTVRTRAGDLLRLTSGPGGDVDPAAGASALHAWLAAGHPVDKLVAEGLTVRTGAVAQQVTVTEWAG